MKQTFDFGGVTGDEEGGKQHEGRETVSVCGEMINDPAFVTNFSVAALRHFPREGGVKEPSTRRAARRGGVVVQKSFVTTSSRVYTRCPRTMAVEGR